MALRHGNVNNVEIAWHDTNISTDTKTCQLKKNVPLTALSVLSARTRDELQRAVYESCRDELSSEDNRPIRLHGPVGKWDVSHVTNMSKIFNNLDCFNYALFD